MNKSILLLALVAVAVFSSCGKRVDCNDAQACVRNVGTDTIHYCWGCSYYGESIAPGETACTNVGEVTINPTTNNYSVVSFNSDHGNYSIAVEDCYVVLEVD
jgi:hypothetical protein